MTEGNERVRLAEILDDESDHFESTVRQRAAIVEVLRAATLQAAELRMPAELVRARLAAGTPLLDGVNVPVPSEAAPLFEKLADAIRTEPDQQAKVDAILAAARNHRVHVEQLVGEAIVSHEDHLRTLATMAGVDRAILALLADLTSRPLLTSIARRLQPALRLGAWTQAYCPICGAFPRFGELDGEQLVLRCARCTTPWAWTLPACPACLTGKLTLEEPALCNGVEADQTRARRAAVCDSCRYSISVADHQELHDLPSLFSYDLLSRATDQMSSRLGGRSISMRARRLEHGDTGVEELDDD